ncbi:MAG: pyrroloquinoline quinone biosynthesis peptide chaperone PqqD [Advenella sp.]|uniref:Pyrroloquinoline quinone biosynthesis peptide chaperone PqqD n=1 Tax=Advenella kashmirensis TaxID=310575 RepID=A0A356LES2_9BURK|nr:pyrroloquinoline quinone biosynthesis peptide chaperone PqqD [Advenella sp. FME57]HBP29412.1 pyrroloquinoline quinone biosynthesis peptide chaperone PqqD [Advenella kashmirensis]
MPDLPEKPLLSRLFRLQYEKAQNAYVLLYPEGMVKLNDSAAEILRRCDGDRNIAQIVADLEQSFATTGLQNDVESFLQAAQERGWIK